MGSPRGIVREITLDALANGTSVRAQMVPRTLGGDENFEKTLKDAREKVRERINITKDLLDLIGPGVRKDESPKAQADLERFSS